MVTVTSAVESSGVGSMALPGSVAVAVFDSSPGTVGAVASTV